MTGGEKRKNLGVPPMRQSRTIHPTNSQLIAGAGLTTVLAKCSQSATGLAAVNTVVAAWAASGDGGHLPSLIMPTQGNIKFIAVHLYVIETDEYNCLLKCKGFAYLSR